VTVQFVMVQCVWLYSLLWCSVCVTVQFVMVQCVWLHSLLRCSVCDCTVMVQCVWLYSLLWCSVCDCTVCYVAMCVTAHFVMLQCVWLNSLLWCNVCDCTVCYVAMCVTVQFVMMQCVWLYSLLWCSVCDCTVCYGAVCVTVQFVMVQSVITLWNAIFQPLVPVAVSIATDYGLNDQRIESRFGREFSPTFRPSLGCTQFSCTMGTVSFSEVKRPPRRSVHPHILPRRFRMSRSIPLLLLWAFVGVLYGNLYLYLYLNLHYSPVSTGDTIVYSSLQQASYRCSLVRDQITVCSGLDR
jgi:hypothetical protein